MSHQALQLFVVDGLHSARALRNVATNARTYVSGVTVDALAQLLVENATLLIHFDDGLATVIDDNSAALVQSEALFVGQWHIGGVLDRQGFLVANSNERVDQGSGCVNVPMAFRVVSLGELV